MSLFGSGKRIISTRTPLAGSDAGATDEAFAKMISTRTPLAGSDNSISTANERIEISTRTPLAGSDQATIRSQQSKRQFQPALPLRGVTELVLSVA